MKVLQRITTEYIDSEDRIRLSGETTPNQTVVLWLTQRLINRLVPHLLTWLEQQTVVSGGLGADLRSDVINSFAQQAAMSSLEQQEPVQVHTAHSSFLVHSVDVTVNQEVLRLTFKGQPKSNPSTPPLGASVSMQTLPLRQWLSILHEQCRLGGWVPTTPEAAGTVWPEWIQARHAGSGAGIAVLH
jgi:hypothetical protein